MCVEALIHHRGLVVTEISRNFQEDAVNRISRFDSSSKFALEEADDQCFDENAYDSDALVGLCKKLN